MAFVRFSAGGVIRLRSGAAIESGSSRRLGTVAEQYMLRVKLRSGYALRARFMSDLKVRPPEGPDASAKRRLAPANDEELHAYWEK